MGKKINPKIFRINTTATHLSKWFVTKQLFPQYLQQDVMMRKLLRKELREAGVARIEIRRSTDQLTFVIYTSKPGVIIGRNGSGIEKLKKMIKAQFFGSAKIKINLEIEEVRRPELDAELVRQSIVNQLEKRVPFRRAMKRAMESVLQAGAKGVKVICSGRLNGVEIARTETLSEGSIPSHTLRADIDYARGAAHTIYGSIGVKVWIYRGQIFKQEAPTPKQPASTIVKSSSVVPFATTKTSTHSKRRTIVKGQQSKRIPNIK